MQRTEVGGTLPPTKTRPIVRVGKVDTSDGGDKGPKTAKPLVWVSRPLPPTWKMNKILQMCPSSATPGDVKAV